MLILKASLCFVFGFCSSDYYLPNILTPYIGVFEKKKYKHLTAKNNTSKVNNFSVFAVKLKHTHQSLSHLKNFFSLLFGYKSIIT